MEERPDPSPAHRRLASLVLTALTAVLAALAGGGATHYWLAARPHHAPTAQHVVAAPPARPRSAEFGAVSPSADVRRVADWVVASADHGGRPFALVDKVQASVYVFAPTGRLVGASPVLLGFARGDDSEPGIGDKPIAAIRPEERTTPAGRFVAQPGRNSGGEKVIWVDYDAAVSMHSVRATVASERRLQRLGSPDPAEHRISWGCINLPAAFFAGVAWPSFGANGGVIYVLPETRPLTDVFPALRGTGAATAG